MAAEEFDDRGLANDPELFSYIDPLCLTVGTPDGYEVVFQLSPTFLLGMESLLGHLRLVVVYGDRIVGDLEDVSVDADGCIRLTIHGVQDLPGGVVDVLLISAAPSNSEQPPQQQCQSQVIASASLPLLPAAAAEEMCLLFEDMMMAADASAPPIMQQESALPGASILDTAEPGLIHNAATYHKVLQRCSGLDASLPKHILPHVPWLVDPARAAVWAHHYQPLLADLRLAVGPGILCSGEQQLPIGVAAAAGSNAAPGDSCAAPTGASKDAQFLLLCRSQVLERLTEYFKQNCMPESLALLHASTAASCLSSREDQPDEVQGRWPPSPPPPCEPPSGVQNEDDKLEPLHARLATGTMSVAAAADAASNRSTAVASPLFAGLPSRIAQAILGFQDSAAKAECVLFQHPRAVSFDSVISALILIVAVCSCFRCYFVASCTPVAGWQPGPLYWRWELLPQLLLAACPLMALRRQRQLLHLSAALSSALMQLLQLAGVLRLPADSVREQVGGWMNVMCFGMLYPSMTQVRFYRLAWVVTLLVACKWWLLGSSLPNLPAARSLLLGAYAASLLLALAADMQGRTAFLETAPQGDEPEMCK